jgi:adenylate cyclase
MSRTSTSDLTGRPPDRRKLIAVLYADMVGYSRLIGLDDSGTLNRLRALRNHVIDPAIAEHGGRLVQTGGDSLLIVFDSIDGAVRFAVKVQQQVPEHDDGHAPDRTIRFRIGINIGDAIADGTDLHGDAVNVAARLQAEYPPGAICVARAVRDHMGSRLDLAFEALGSLNLKNIAQPIEAFVLAPHAAATPPKSIERSLGDNAREAWPTPAKPSIAVLAFTDMSGDPEQEYFSDGVADDIITDLSRNRALFVIARNSSFTYKGRAVDVKLVARELGVRYVLEGSVRSSGGRVRVNAQLIDAETGNHLWAERYDRERADVFSVQDEITTAVIRAVGPVVADAEQRRALRKPPRNLGAWEAYQRGLWHLSQYKLEDFPRAREFFNRALELDPTMAAVHTGLAWLYRNESGFFASRPLAEATALAVDEARKAVDLDPTDAEAHAHLSQSLGALGDFSGAFEHVERALSIDPNCVPAYHAKGWLLVYSGRPAEGREATLFAMRLDPRSKLNMRRRGYIAMSYYFEGDYENAFAVGKNLLTDHPGHPWAGLLLAAALGQLDQTDEARDALGKAKAIAPDAFVFVRRRVPWMRQVDYDHMLNGLRKAGWEG